MSTAVPEAGRISPIAPRKARRLDLGQEVGTWLIRLLLIAISFLVLLPAIWVFSASIEKGSAAFSTSLIPTSFTWDNYSHIYNDGLWTWLKNSAIVCTTAGVFSLLFNTLGAYAFSRLRFWGDRYGLMVLFLIQIFPQIMALPAIYALLIKVNLLDTYWGLALVFIGGNAFNMWLMKNYIDSIPRELDEAAAVDGASSVQIFFQVVLPLIRPMLVTLFIWSFAAAYTDFAFSSVVLTGPDHYTVAVGLFHEIDGQPAINYAYFSAGAVLSSLPILAIYMALQRQLISGLGTGAVKG